MNLVIDIGNTLAKLAVFENDHLIEVIHDSNQSLNLLEELTTQYTFEHAIVSSVITISETIKQQLTKQTFESIKLNDKTPLPIINKYGSPETLGVDRLAAVVGANYLVPQKNILVIDAGTAITYDFINYKGEYIGGNISPGVRIRLKALHTFCEKIPSVEKKGEVTTWGYNTETAIRSGIYKGIQFEMEGYINELRQKHEDVLIFLTGGDCFSFVKSLKSGIFADSFLVLKGLNRILSYNVKR